MAYNLFQLRASTWLRDPEVAARLGLTEAEGSCLAERLCDRSGDVAATARDLGAALRPKVELLEWVEMNSSARREYDATCPVWTYDLSAPTRVCLALLDALDALAHEAGAPVAAA